jgi:spermidine synthase
MGRRMRLLGRYKGQFGAIDIVERLDDGARLYLEEGIYQSQATGDGELPFAYVRLMAGILSRATNVLLLGCGGGTLATMMVRDGKGVTVVDRNPISFQIAERFFGMPPGVTCVCADFRDFLRECQFRFDGIGIDISGPGFDAAASFDPATCTLVRARLSDRGRIAMNVSAASDVDPAPDRIAALLAGNTLRAWIFDHPGRGERNAILACRPERSFKERDLLGTAETPDEDAWVCRRTRLELRKPH